MPGFISTTVLGLHQGRSRGLVRSPGPATSLAARLMYQAVGSWYDGRDGSGVQLVPSRINPTHTLQLGSTTGVDAADPAWTTGVDGRPCWVGATGDYMVSPSADAPAFTATSGRHTVILAISRTGTANFASPWSSEATTNRGLFFYFGAGSGNNRMMTIRVGDGTNVIQAAGFDSAGSAFSYTDGVIEIVAAVINDGTLRGYRYGNGLQASTSIAALSVLGITHGAPKVGARVLSGTPQNHWLGETYFVRSLPGVALTGAELDAISAAFLAEEI